MIIANEFYEKLKEDRSQQGKTIKKLELEKGRKKIRDVT